MGPPWGRRNSGDLSTEEVENALVGTPIAAAVDVIILEYRGHHHQRSPSGFPLEYH